MASKTLTRSIVEATHCRNDRQTKNNDNSFLPWPYHHHHEHHRRRHPNLHQGEKCWSLLQQHILSSHTSHYHWNRFLRLSMFFHLVSWLIRFTFAQIAKTEMERSSMMSSIYIVDSSPMDVRTLNGTSNKLIVNQYHNIVLAFSIFVSDLLKVNGVFTWKTIKLSSISKKEPPRKKLTVRIKS